MPMSFKDPDRDSQEVHTQGRSEKVSLVTRINRSAEESLSSCSQAGISSLKVGAWNLWEGDFLFVALVDYLNPFRGFHFPVDEI
ncbi:hypothetical protein F2Q69_00048541 [Brassica cretica]|uniref:Uncharacterized protein n=1 Tax=Brassica cretica TaxID=69181 RepID=A0A8S9PQ99_BRACR|nr:hypothetical protein F2Q69_00048541 [Brassica cretica]